MKYPSNALQNHVIVLLALLILTLPLPCMWAISDINLYLSVFPLGSERVKCAFWDFYCDNILTYIFREGELIIYSEYTVLMFCFNYHFLHCDIFHNIIIIWTIVISIVHGVIFSIVFILKFYVLQGCLICVCFSTSYYYSFFL